MGGGGGSFLVAECIRNKIEWLGSNMWSASLAFQNINTIPLVALRSTAILLWISVLNVFLLSVSRRGGYGHTDCVFYPKCVSSFDQEVFQTCTHDCVE